MAFKPLVQQLTGDEMLESLPWANKWVRDNEDYDIPRDIVFCQIYSTGIMVVCNEYKGYLYEGSEQHKHLLEALKVWKGLGTSTNVLQVVCNRKGKITVGVNEELVNHRWFYSEERYTQIQKKSGQVSDMDTSPNPLLAGDGVRTTVDKTEGTTESVKNSRSRGSTKG